MKNQQAAYLDRLTEWADRHGLIASRRSACGHGLRAVPVTGVRADEHGRLCRLPTLGPAPTLWNRDGRPAVLLTHLHAPEEGVGREAVAERVARYARAFGVAGHLAPTGMSLYGRGTSPALYVAAPAQLSEFVQLDRWGRLR